MWEGKITEQEAQQQQATGRLKIDRQHEVSELITYLGRYVPNYKKVVCP